MADAEGAGGDRTEAPTGRRLQRARDAGEVAVSRELGVLAVLAASGFMLATTAAETGTQLAHRLIVFLIHFDLSDPTAIRLAALAATRASIPILGVTSVVGVGAVLLQTGFLLSAAPLVPSLGRISPIAGLRRLLSVDSAIEAGKSLVKLVVIAAALYWVLSADLPRLMTAPFRDPRTLPATALALSMHVVITVVGVQAAIAVLDVVQVRLRHTRSLRMSRMEVRDEHKEMEGDPRVKARLRRLRVQRARKRMLAAVPKATVVITNPTHYAVALAYDRAKNAAPRLVAKGVDTMAERIRELAREHAVPLVANPPLARALHRLEVDTDIPPEHYKAVAEIIAYVWRLRSRAAPFSTAPAPRR
jgi:flagellar biosynthetic protein FlhB